MKNKEATELMNKLLNGEFPDENGRFDRLEGNCSRDIDAGFEKT